MATLKVLLRKRNISGNKYPVIIRIRHERKQSEYTIPGIGLKEEHWDAKNSRINVASKRDSMYSRQSILNSRINKVKRRVEQAMDELHLSEESFEASDVFDKAFGKSENVKNKSFSNYFDEYIDNNPEDLKPSTLVYYRTTLKNWKKCHGKLLIGKLTTQKILKFRKYLKSLGIATNTIYNRMKTVRKMTRRAMKQGLLDKDPFQHISLKQEKGNREHLTMDEVKALERVKPESKTEGIVKDLFLFGCYTGLRFSDMCKLKNKNIKQVDDDYRLNFRMSKTRETLTFKLPDKAKQLLQKYESDKENKYVFPFLNKLKKTSEKAITRKISSANAMSNKYIKDLAKRANIEKHCSMHVSRHTYACISLEIGADIYVLSKMLGHGSLKSTQIYAKVVDKRKDELVDMWNKQ